MKAGRFFISTGFYQSGTRHFLVALHRRWRLAFVRPAAKPDYRRLYLGPLEIEWSKSAPPITTIGAGTVGNIKLGSNCDTARTTIGGDHG